MSLDVGPDDIDQLGHASNLAYVRWIQDIAVAHSTSVGFDFGAYLTLGAVFVVRRHEVDYLRQVMVGDRVCLRTWLPSVSTVKCIRSTEIMRRSDARVVARAQTTWGYIELATGRPIRIPDAIRTAFGVAAARSWRPTAVGQPDVS